MDLPLYTGVQAAVETVGFSGQSHGDSFWDACGIIQINYHQKGRTINGECYTNLLYRFNDDLNEKLKQLA